MTDARLRHLEALLGATTIEAVWDLHLKAMADHGFDRLIYGFTRFMSPRGVGPSNDLLVLSNMPQDYIEKYIHERLFENAPMVRWAGQNTGACSWRWVETQYETLTAAERAVIAFNARYGLRAGVTISFAEFSTRSRGAMALIARNGMTQDDIDALWAAEGRGIHLLNNAFHLKATSLPHTGANPLTPRQREVLEWVGDGKSVQDIAVILGVRPATVEKHLRLARAALGVATTAQAVLKASVKNQIYIAAPPRQRPHLPAG